MSAMIGSQGRENKDPRQQSNEEWLRDYDGDKPDSKPGIRSQPEPTASSSVVRLHRNKSQSLPPTVFEYLDYRTTRNNAIAMDFVSTDGVVKATHYIPVKLLNNRGRRYRPGARGQFVSAKGGNFRKFWMNAVGEEPPQWCRAYKSMSSKLQGKLFTGDVSVETDSKGKQYNKLTNLIPLEQALIGHK